MSTHTLNCRFLSPVHIGSGQTIDPLQYVIRDGVLHRVSFERFIARISPELQAKFTQLADRADLNGLRRFIADNLAPEHDSLARIAVSPGVDAHYRSKLADIGNQLLMEQFARTDGERTPFLPGSAVKGSIRTAVISAIAAKSGLPKPFNSFDEKTFEPKVLNYRDAKSDPFRCIMIGDGNLRPQDSIFREVRNGKKRNGAFEFNSIPLIVEVTNSMLTGNDVDVQVRLLVNDKLANTKFIFKAITVEEIIRSCNAFYRDKLEAEHKKHYAGTQIEKVSSRLLDEPVGQNEFLLRVGRFSGAESVTLDVYRNPKPPGNRRVWGTSRFLVEQMYPLGWVKVTVG